VRRSPRVLALRILAVALALFTARLVASDLATLHRRAGRLGPLVTIVEARRAIALGDVVENGALRAVERYESQMPTGALRRLDDAVGRVAIVPLVAGSPVLADHLAGAARSSTASLLAPGRRAVRIAAGDGLRPPVGSIVEVYASVDATTTVVASGARVLALDGGTEGREIGVLVEVRADEAARLAFAAANGALMIALAPPEDACCNEETPGPASQ